VGFGWAWGKGRSYGAQRKRKKRKGGEVLGSSKKRESTGSDEAAGDVGGRAKRGRGELLTTSFNKEGLDGPHKKYHRDSKKIFRCIA